MRDMRIVFLQFVISSMCFGGGILITAGSDILRVIAIVVGFSMMMKVIVDVRLEIEERRSKENERT
jgi:hypothetical protein